MAAYDDLYRQMEQVAEARASELSGQRNKTWECFQKGTPLAAEEGTVRAAAAKKRTAKQFRVMPQADLPPGAESIQGDRDNFVPVSFLETGAQVARAVAQVDAVETNKVGSGFMCAPGLFITNFHVLPSEDVARTAVIKFDFIFGDGVAPTHFRLDPDRCFVFDGVRERDYAIVAVGRQLDGPFNLEEFGWCPLSNAGNKHSLGEFANIIQHPEGEPKQVVLQDNLIAARDEFVLHYFADTEGGSSGSPVFNNDWQVIALHHWGRALHTPAGSRDYNPDTVNEGIRISQIVEHARDQRDSLKPSARDAIDSMLTVGFTQRRPDTHPQPVSPGGFEMGSRNGDGVQTPGIDVGSDGATWTIPLRISVSIPGVSGSQLRYGTEPERPRDDSDRLLDAAETSLPLTGEGYRPDFLDGNIIELPRMSAAMEDRIAPLLDPDAHPSAKPGELQFTHFSVVVDKERKQPFFGACNVDGKTLFGISSSNQSERDYRDSGEPDFAASIGGAEGAHSWRPDHRISKAHQLNEKWYTRKNKLKPRAGTDDQDRYVDIADFDRGHIVRRTEPIWGSSEAGQAANRQTYNHANAAPQDPRFNQDKDRFHADIDDGEETRSWYGMEVAVLRAATNEDQKMNVFTGPIFEDTDPVYGPGKSGGGDCQVPLTFWKIAVWEHGGKLKALAMKYSQAFAVEKSGAESGGAEALDTAEQLFLLRDFLTTVEDIQDRTGILFGQKVRNADIFSDFDGDDFSGFSLDNFADILTA